MQASGSGKYDAGIDLETCLDLGSCSVMEIRRRNLHKGMDSQVMSVNRSKPGHVESREWRCGHHCKNISMPSTAKVSPSRPSCSMVQGCLVRVINLKIAATGGLEERILAPQVLRKNLKDKIWVRSAWINVSLPPQLLSQEPRLCPPSCT